MKSWLEERDGTFVLFIQPEEDESETFAQWINDGCQGPMVDCYSIARANDQMLIRSQFREEEERKNLKDKLTNMQSDYERRIDLMQKSIIKAASGDLKKYRVTSKYDKDEFKKECAEGYLIELMQGVFNRKSPFPVGAIVCTSDDCSGGRLDALLSMGYLVPVSDT